ncbi:MAG: hypothetical protein NTW96_24785 [Planctomycetia bacterium]|nr:hypothetical protein [Planctomycetia bacterium]
MVRMTCPSVGSYHAANEMTRPGQFRLWRGGQWDTITRYADLAATDLVATGEYGYDLAGRLTSLGYEKGLTTLVEYDWSYDAAGRMTEYVNSLDGTVDYTNDDAGQLTGADYDYQDDEAYAYDENGNRETANGSTYATGDGNQLLSDGTYRYAYDDEGNRTLRYVDDPAQGTQGQLDAYDTDITEYDWDYRNRLTQVEHFDTYAHYSTGTSDQIVEYAYDYQNRLIHKTLDPDGTSSGSGTIEQTVFVHLRQPDRRAVRQDRHGRRRGGRPIAPLPLGTGRGPASRGRADRRPPNARRRALDAHRPPQHRPRPGDLRCPKRRNHHRQPPHFPRVRRRHRRNQRRRRLW